jgi:hypothetical protein
VELHRQYSQVDSVLANLALVAILGTSSILNQDANPERPGYRCGEVRDDCGERDRWPVRRSLRSVRLVRRARCRRFFKTRCRSAFLPTLIPNPDKRPDTMRSHGMTSEPRGTQDSARCAVFGGRFAHSRAPQDTARR